MKKPKAEKINLPYASTVANFYGDQGQVQGNSFLGRLFKGGGVGQRVQTQPGAAPSTPGFGGLLNKLPRGTSK